MKLFIDSGNLKDIEGLVPLGIIDGITTNPSLLAKEGGDYRALLKKICQLVKGPTSAEVVATDAEGMIRLVARFGSFEAARVVLEMKAAQRNVGKSGCSEFEKTGVSASKPNIKWFITLAGPLTRTCLPPNSSFSRALVRSAWLRSLYRSASAASNAIFAPPRGLWSISGTCPKLRLWWRISSLQ